MDRSALSAPDNKTTEEGNRKSSNVVEEAGAK
jgi:hypothetical protein